MKNRRIHLSTAARRTAALALSAALLAAPALAENISNKTLTFDNNEDDWLGGAAVHKYETYTKTDDEFVYDKNTADNAGYGFTAGGAICIESDADADDDDDDERLEGEALG